MAKPLLCSLRAGRHLATPAFARYKRPGRGPPSATQSDSLSSQGSGMPDVIHQATRALACVGLLLAITSESHAQGLTPQQARNRMVVPEGFKVEVFASEPEIRQPVAACFDER